MEHHTVLSPCWAAVRDDLSVRREARAAREILKRELASFSTTADLLKLDLILNRAGGRQRPEPHPPPQRGLTRRGLTQRGHRTGKAARAHPIR